jgi:hypothetical protein
VLSQTATRSLWGSGDPIGRRVRLEGAVSLAANRLLVALLYEVSAADTATYAGVLAILLSVSAAAIAVPARSSTRVDPALTLRVE